MPKAKNPLSAEEQAERFKAEVERLVAAGELDPAEADATLDNVVKGQQHAEGKRGTIHPKVVENPRKK